MVITDRLSKNTIIKLIKTAIMEVIAEALLWCLIRHHRLPRAIVSNRG